MNKNIYLLLTLLSALSLILLSNIQTPKTATIESIQTTPYKTIITLQNKTTELIIFEPLSLNLSKGDQIKFQGKPDTYKNQKQIVISKLSKI